MKLFGMLLMLALMMFAAVPVARADYRTDVCAPGNAWDGTFSTGAGGVVPLAMLTESQDHIAVLGHADGATTLHLLASMDDVTYYDTGLTLVIAGAGDFSASFHYETVFLALKSSNDVTITASICAFEG